MKLLRTKHSFQGYAKITAFILLFTLLAGALNAAALGEQLRNTYVALGEGVQLASGVFFASDKQTENYFVYTPNMYVSPVVVYGSKLCNYGNFQTMAGLLEKKGYNVVGGINGDFYVLSTYQPLGIVITDGILRSSDAGHYAIGFRADGSAFIDKPALEMRVKIGTENYKLGGINKVREDNNYYFYTEDFSYTTKNSAPGRDVILRLVQPEINGEAPYTGAQKETRKLTVNCSLTFVVEQILESNGEITLPEGKYVLSLPKSADEWRQYGIDNLETGDTITLDVSCAEKWNSVEQAVGSYVKLVTSGQKDAGIPDTNTDKGQHPRSAAGIRADGSIVLYTVDGRQSGYSEGLTTQQVAERLIELGCVDAILLDGGGSTNIQALYIGDSDLTPINKPSDGKERSVTNYIMLAAKGSGSGTVRNIGVYPFDALVLAGSVVPFTIKTSDETCRAVKAPSELDWSLSSDSGGSVNGNGVFTAGKSNSELRVFAEYGGARGSALVTIVESPSEITIKNPKTGREIGTLALIAGETFELSASAIYKQMELYCSNEAFEWEALDGIGTIQNGVFTASVSEGRGLITARAGDTTASIEVSVRSETELIDGFEDGINLFVSNENVSISTETEKDYVRFGDCSARVSYSIEDRYVFFEAPLKVSEKMNYISLWVYGDMSGNMFSAGFEDGTVRDIAVLDFSGWQQFVIDLPPSEAGELVGFSIGGGGLSTIWLDCIVASTSPEPDNLAPGTELNVSDGVVSGFVSDAVNGVPDKEAVELLYDGKPLEFSLNSSTGNISAVLPGDPRPETESGEESGFFLGVTHKLTLSASDKSGNIGSASVLLEAGEPSAFIDMGGHWSSSYVNFVYHQGIVNGIETDEGFIFNPNSEVTRAQFAVMMARYLKLDLSLYDEIPEFDDLDQIPEYAMQSVKAVCALGIIKGLDNGGSLVFDPNSALTRAQAMTVIGRVQPGGYAENPIEFQDADSIPSWSRRYVKTLVGQGIISGFEDGTLRPNESLTRAQIAKILTETT